MALPDLSAHISAFEDQAGTKLIPNGGHIGYGGGAPSSWIFFKVKNLSNTDAQNFFVKLVVKCNGSKVYDPPSQKITLPAGLSKEYQPVQVSLPGITNNIEALITVDAENIVQESNEFNNIAKHTFKVSIVH